MKKTIKRIVILLMAAMLLFSCTDPIEFPEENNETPTVPVEPDPLPEPQPEPEPEVVLEDFPDWIKGKELYCIEGNLFYIYDEEPNNDLTGKVLVPSYASVGDYVMKDEEAKTTITSTENSYEMKSGIEKEYDGIISDYSIVINLERTTDDLINIYFEKYQLLGDERTVLIKAEIKARYN